MAQVIAPVGQAARSKPGDEAQTPSASSLEAAVALAQRNRAQSWRALDGLFRSGTVPAVDGRYSGALLALEVAPGLTQFVRAVTAAWLPWQGKAFVAAEARGDNIFTQDSLGLAHVFWPFYRGYVHDGPDTYRAFAFRTRVAPGLFDSDRQVLKIDYDLAANPGLSVRHVLDELVQLEPGLYLGKAHLRWWWGQWQTVAFFSLQAKE